MNKINSKFKTMKINYLNLNVMKTSKFFISALFCLALVTSFTSCSDDDDPEPVNEEELITNLTLTFTNTANNDEVVMTSVAPDGLEEGATTENVTGSFTAGATYELTLALVNASETPAEDVLNGDIIPEADEHFFVYAVSNGLDMTMTRDGDDVDGPDGSKLGVNTTWVANSAGTGNLQIILVHEPGSVDDSDEFGSATGGSEDFNITFTDVTIN